MDAVTVLRTLYGIRDLGDFIYDVREREGKGWDGPKVQAWGEACEAADRIVKEAGGPIEVAPPQDTV